MQSTALCHHCKLLNIIDPDDYSYCSRCNARLMTPRNETLVVLALIVLCAIGALGLNVLASWLNH